MNRKTISVLQDFKHRVREAYPGARLTLFGSQARNDAGNDSDVDVLVVVADNDLVRARRVVGDCAWDAGFDSDVFIAPTVALKTPWENGPLRYSLLAEAVRADGVPL